MHTVQECDGFFYVVQPEIFSINGPFNYLAEAQELANELNGVDDDQEDTV